jgi:hypothetical protein
MAVAFTPRGQAEPTYGGLFFAGQTATDLDARVVTLFNLKLTDAAFDAATAEQRQRLKDKDKAKLAGRRRDVAFDRILACLPPPDPAAGVRHVPGVLRERAGPVRWLAPQEAASPAGGARHSCRDNRLSGAPHRGEFGRVGRRRRPGRAAFQPPPGRAGRAALRRRPPRPGRRGGVPAGGRGVACLPGISGARSLVITGVNVSIPMPPNTLVARSILSR